MEENKIPIMASLEFGVGFNRFIIKMENIVLLTATVLIIFQNQKIIHLIII